MDNAKSRLIAYANFRDISLQSFALNLERSRNYFRVEGTVDSDLLALISIKYPDLNLFWVITGKGEMINWEYAPRKSKYKPPVNPADTQDIMNLKLPDEDTLTLLRDRVSLLTREINIQHDIIARISEIITRGEKKP
jgi:hypothetical protein